MKAAARKIGTSRAPTRRAGSGRDATRNTKDFEGLGLRLMDPWRA